MGWRGATVRLSVLVIALSGAMATVAPAQAIQPGDVLSISCEADPTWSVQRVIGSNGTIALPSVGSFAVGTTIADAGKTISGRLVRAGFDASVDVRLAGTRRRTVSVTGAVAHSLEMPWYARLTLGDLLTVACQNAPSRVVVTDGWGRTAATTLPAGAPMLLIAGDRITVPLADYGGDILLVGAFGHPGAIRSREGMTLGQAIEAAGGLALDADAGTITVQAPGATPKRATGEEPLSAGSVVRVFQHVRAGLVSVAGRVDRAGPYRVRPGLGLLSLLRQAGWQAVEGAMTCTIGHLRLGRIASVDYDLRDVLSGKRTEPTVMPGDSIVVGS